MAHRSILSRLGTVVFFLLLGAAATARAEPPPQGAGPEAGAAGTARDQALQWVDRYRRDQTLFHDKDIERLVDRISRATPAQAEAWLEETQAIRAALDSPQWKETQQWFKEFLEVQAIYSDDDIARLRDEAQDTAKNAPEKFMELLADIERRRSRMATGAANASRLREQKLQLTQAYKKESAAQRAQARRRQPQRAAGRAPAPVRAKQKRRTRPPLVDSLDVARAAVSRSFWRSW